MGLTLGGNRLIFVPILLILITIVHAPNVCDPFNPCGCNPPIKKVDVHLPIQGQAVIRYEENGFGIIARSCSKLFDRDRVELNCRHLKGLEVAFCDNESLDEIKHIEVVSNRTHITYYFTYYSLIDNRLYDSYIDAVMYEIILKWWKNFVETLKHLF